MEHSNLDLGLKLSHSDNLKKEKQLRLKEFNQRKYLIYILKAGMIIAIIFAYKIKFLSKGGF